MAQLSPPCGVGPYELGWLVAVAACDELQPPPMVTEVGLLLNVLLPCCLLVAVTMGADLLSATDAQELHRAWAGPNAFPLPGRGLMTGSSVGLFADPAAYFLGLFNCHLRTFCPGGGSRSAGPCRPALPPRHSQGVK